MIPNEIRASLDHVAGLSRVNAGLGATAAFALLDGAVDSAAAAQCLRRLRLPGRLSVHETELNGGTKWVVDAAINGVGAQAALNWTRETLGEPETVLLSVPLSKDREGCLQALASTHIVEVAGSSHLKFAAQPNGDPLPNLQEAIERNLVHGGIVLAIGTITFVADVLDEVDAATESWLMVS
jgi:folylpolyglutamate synthase/dihydropteroate synthase